MIHRCSSYIVNNSKQCIRLETLIFFNENTLASINTLIYMRTLNYENLPGKKYP